jgi:hypothetical protein
MTYIRVTTICRDLTSIRPQTQDNLRVSHGVGVSGFGWPPDDPPVALLAPDGSRQEAGSGQGIAGISSDWPACT